MITFFKAFIQILIVITTLLFTVEFAKQVKVYIYTPHNLETIAYLLLAIVVLGYIAYRVEKVY